MNTNGPFLNSSGAVETIRGKVIDFLTTAAGQYSLGMIRATRKNRVWLQLIFTDELSFDGSGDVEIRVVNSMGITLAYLKWTQVVPTYTGFTPDSKPYMLMEDAEIFVIYTPLDSTLGLTTAIVRASGLGQLPISI
jgi:hypothetical protein